MTVTDRAPANRPDRTRVHMHARLTFSMLIFSGMTMMQR